MTTVYTSSDGYFQQDNASCHKAQIISDWFLEHDNEFTLLKCPPQSPDLNPIEQWFSNFLHQVPPQKIFGFPSTIIMTNIKMQYKWLPTAPVVCSRCVCVCVCVHCCVCVHFGWVKCRAQILSMSHHFHFQ